MWKRLLLVTALAFAIALTMAPARLMDGVLARATEGRLRLMHTSGTVWHGSGVFVSLSPDGRSAQPWLSGTWASELNLPGASIGWRLDEAGQTVLHVTLDPGGVSVTRAALDAPLRALLDSLPSPIARAGWRGVLRIESGGVTCGWNQECHGAAKLTWLDAGVDLLPQQRFGDYTLDAEARGRLGDFEVRTLGGDIRIDGRGGWDAQGQPRFRGEISGPEAIVGRLPNVMDGYAFPTADPKRVRIDFN